MSTVKLVAAERLEDAANALYSTAAETSQLFDDPLEPEIRDYCDRLHDQAMMLFSKMIKQTLP